MCSANNEPTELLFGNDLTKHVKDLTMTNMLKRSESYYKVTRNISPALEVSLKHTPKNFHGGQIAEHIQEWQKLTSDRFVLQVVRGDTKEFENDIPVKHTAKNLSFSPEEEVEIQIILEEMLHKQFIRETNH